MAGILQQVLSNPFLALLALPILPLLLLADLPVLGVPVAGLGAQAPAGFQNAARWDFHYDREGNITGMTVHRKVEMNG